MKFQIEPVATANSQNSGCVSRFIVENQNNNRWHPYFRIREFYHLKGNPELALDKSDGRNLKARVNLGPAAICETGV